MTRVSNPGGRPAIGPAFSIKFPPDLLARVDAARGDVSRAEWLRRAAETALRTSTSQQPSPFADLRERLVEADAELTAMASPDMPGHYDEKVRLRAKAEGVRLALSYLNEYENEGERK